MKKLTLGLFFVLAACSAPQPEPVVLEEPMIEAAPVMAAPVMMPRCPTDQVIARDGIGGTGCR
ncbi:hypothetical protein [Yoonia sp. SS1-5]|uniref:Lipoprotein n=1 Tax=Yoonia rhodophyticola TaxID=3137370 RepID=A0AAN0M7Y5_9RHOB